MLTSFFLFFLFLMPESLLSDATTDSGVHVAVRGGTIRIRVRIIPPGELDVGYLRERFVGRLSKIGRDGQQVRVPASANRFYTRHYERSPRQFPAWMGCMADFLQEQEGNITLAASEIMKRTYLSHTDRLAMLHCLLRLGLEVQINHHKDPWKVAYGISFTQHELAFVGKYQELFMRYGARLDYNDYAIFIRALHDGRLPLLAWLCKRRDAPGQKFFDLVCICGSAPITASKLAGRLLRERSDVRVKGTEGCFAKGLVLMDLHGGWK